MAMAHVLCSRHACDQGDGVMGRGRHPGAGFPRARSTGFCRGQTKAGPKAGPLLLCVLGQVPAGFP